MWRTAVHVKVAADGSVTIPRVDVACDAGRVINPERVISQMEGACIYGMTACFAQITAKDGVHRAGQLQRVHGGAHAAWRRRRSACTSSTAAGNIRREAWVSRARRRSRRRCANAIFAATGKRITELPIDTQKLAG